MSNDSLNEFHTWARAQLNTTVMLGYKLDKVNGQTPGKVFLLLRENNSLRVNAEIEVAYDPDQHLPYQAIFSLLPFNVGYPRPVGLRPFFNAQQEVMHWIKTGQNQFRK